MQPRRKIIVVKQEPSVAPKRKRGRKSKDDLRWKKQIGKPVMIDGVLIDDYVAS